MALEYLGSVLGVGMFMEKLPAFREGGWEHIQLNLEPLLELQKPPTMTDLGWQCKP